MSISKSGKGLRSPYVLAAIGAFLLVIIGWQFYKYRIVNRNVDKAVTEKSKGLYHITYNGLRFDEVGGTLHVEHVEIVPDTIVYNQMVAAKTNPPLLIRISVPALDISGIKTPKALLNKEIEGGKIEIVNPIIEIEQTHAAKDSTAGDPGQDIYKELLGKFLKIQMDSVEIVNAKVTVRNLHSDEAAFSGTHISLLLSGVQIDSTTYRDSSRLLFSRNLDLEAEEIVLPFKDKKYRLYAEKFRFAGRGNALTIGSIRLVPQLSESEFARTSIVQKDRYDLSMEGISVYGIDRKALWQKGIGADSIIVNNSSFKIFRDLSYPHDSISRLGKYPQQQLMRLSVPVLIRKMVLVHSFIEYKEKNAKSDSAGKVQFYNVRATIGNITNRRPAIARNDRCTIAFRAEFLDKAPVDAQLTLLLGEPHGKFFIEGNVGAIDVSSLNTLTQPMGLARMEQGKIGGLHFHFTGLDSSSEGKVEMLYSGLKVSLLKKDKKENKYDKKGLESLAAGILIKKSNPEKGQAPRVVDVHFKRIMNKSFFNLIWKTIFAGIKETVGVKKT